MVEIRDYKGFVEALQNAGFSMGGGNDEGIFSLIPWSWDETPPYETPVRWHTGNPDTVFCHCLPAFHNTETKVGKDIYERFGLDGIEVTDDVFEAPFSLAFQEAANRLPTIKAVMVASFAEYPIHE